MKLPAGFILLAGPLLAHVMSMSSGGLTINGTRGHYEFRFPVYELPHVKEPEQSLFANIAFISGGKAARLVSRSCHEEGPWYACAADYEFAAPVDALEVRCTFYAVTVPNHVHLLRVENNGKRDQGLFDISFPSATLQFRAPGPVAVAASQVGAGCMRALGGFVQILFLAALVLAARRRRELFLLAAMFLAGQMGSALLLPLTGWQPPARFVEAAAALSIAYLAVEVLLLPEAGMRWLIVAVLGAFHGLYFHLFLQTTGYRAVYVLAGAAIAEIAAIALFAVLFAQVRKLAALKPVQVAASVLFVIGIAWFFLRLKG